MTRLLTVSEGGEIDFDVLDVGAAERVVVKLAVAETPFYFNRALKDRTGPRRPDKPHEQEQEPARPAEERPGKPKRKKDPGRPAGEPAIVSP